MTINDLEQKKAYSIVEAIILGFQNEAKNPVVYDALQEVYNRVHEELQPILDREIREANEERGKKALAKHLGIKQYIADFMLTDLELLDTITRLQKDPKPKVNACYVGDLHQQILISNLSGDPLEVINVWEE